MIKLDEGVYTIVTLHAVGMDYNPMDAVKDIRDLQFQGEEVDGTMRERRTQ